MKASVKIRYTDPLFPASKGPKNRKTDSRSARDRGGCNVRSIFRFTDSRTFQSVKQLCEIKRIHERSDVGETLSGQELPDLKLLHQILYQVCLSQSLLRAEVCTLGITVVRELLFLLETVYGENVIKVKT